MELSSNHLLFWENKKKRPGAFDWNRPTAN